MPIFYFECPECKTSFRRLCKAVEVSEVKCACGGQPKRTPKPPGVKVTEVLDNGAMVKRVERVVDVERLINERNRKT